jgi:hypothetical protein
MVTTGRGAAGKFLPRIWISPPGRAAGGVTDSMTGLGVEFRNEGIRDLASNYD